MIYPPPKIYKLRLKKYTKRSHDFSCKHEISFLKHSHNQFYCNSKFSGKC